MFGLRTSALLRPSVFGLRISAPPGPPPRKLAPAVCVRQCLGMGTFYVGCKVENVAQRSKTATIPKLLVDTGSEYTWVPETTLDKLDIQREKKGPSFTMANGQNVTRSVGFAIVRVDTPARWSPRAVGRWRRRRECRTGPRPAWLRPSPSLVLAKR